MRPAFLTRVADRAGGLEFFHVHSLGPLAGVRILGPGGAAHFVSLHRPQLILHDHQLLQPGSGLDSVPERLLNRPFARQARGIPLPAR